MEQIISNYKTGMLLRCYPSNYSSGSNITGWYGTFKNGRFGFFIIRCHQVAGLSLIGCSHNDTNGSGDEVHGQSGVSYNKNTHLLTVDNTDNAWSGGGTFLVVPDGYWIPDT